MTVIKETVVPPKPSRSSEVVKSLECLYRGECITLLPETDRENDLGRQRVLWYNAAKRAGIAIISRRVVTKAGDRAIRIWRTDYS